MPSYAIVLWGCIFSWCNWVTLVIINCVFIPDLFLYSLPGLDQELPIPDYYEIWPTLRPPWRSAETQRTHDGTITSLLRQNDVATSFWRNNDVIITACRDKPAEGRRSGMVARGGWNKTVPRTSVSWTVCLDSRVRSQACTIHVVARLGCGVDHNLSRCSKDSELLLTIYEISILNFNYHLDSCMTL